MKQEARVSVRYEFGFVAKGADGWEKDIGLMNDSFSSWLAIVHWNLHYRRWHALAANARDLFTKVIWRKLWRRS